MYPLTLSTSLSPAHRLLATVPVAASLALVIAGCLVEEVPESADAESFATADTAGDKAFDSSDKANAPDQQDELVLVGTPGNDLLIGSPGPDSLAGGFGDDRLYGMDGNDLLEGEADNDRLYGKNGDDTLLGESGRDQLYGQEGDDFLNGGIDEDLLYGGPGEDTLEGSNGADILFGGPDIDRLLGGPGNDSIYATSQDVIDGGEGFDRVIAETNSPLQLELSYANVEFVSGKSGDDAFYAPTSASPIEMFGGPGHDTLSGGLVADSLDGGDGDDILFGGPGNDTLRGGPGIDVAVFAGDTADYDVVPRSDGGQQVTHLPSGDIDIAYGIENILFSPAPIAANDAAATDIDTPLTLPAGLLLGNDTGASPIRLIGAGNPQNGIVALDSAGDVVFQPFPFFSGIATLEYAIADDSGVTAIGVVTVTVGGGI